MSQSSDMKGRGSATNPASRFDRLQVQWEIPPPDREPTQFLVDASKTVIATNSSPDVGFDASINPYRGCEHGCSYCYARNTHEYLGFSAGLDFETRILVKQNAPELLRRELASPKWKPTPLGMCGVTDPYQPVERKLEITRRSLEVLAEARNPVMLVTKNHLVTRDIDHLTELARHNCVAVTISIPSLDPHLTRIMEPRASHPRDRIKAIAELSRAGIPSAVNIAPLIPGLTDHEIPSILKSAAEAGATRANYILLKLPGAVRGLFVSWLEEHFPDRKDKVLSRVRQLRRGKLNSSDFATRGRGEGHLAKELHEFFEIHRKRAGLEKGAPFLSTESFRRPELEQKRLFD